jgi:hypothetical protein
VPEQVLRVVADERPGGGVVSRVVDG